MLSVEEVEAHGKSCRLDFSDLYMRSIPVGYQQDAISVRVPADYSNSIGQLHPDEKPPSTKSV